MISETEWKFFEATEQRIKHLAHHQAENLLALLAGEPPPWNPAELAERQAAILGELDYPTRVEDALRADPTPQQARHLELHRRWALRALFETHPDLAPLQQDLFERSVRFRAEIGGRSLSPAAIQHLLREEPDRELREKAWWAMGDLGESLAGDLTELLRRREMLARTVAETGFPSLAFHAHEQERATVVGLLDEFERFTRKAYEGMRGEVARALEIHAVEPWDLEFGLARLGTLPRGHFPADLGLDRVRRQAGRWGFSSGTSIVVEERDHFGWRAIALRVPDSIRIVGSPRDGLDGHRHLFRAYGEALHHAGVGSPRHFLQQEPPASIRGSGDLFQAVLWEEEWLAEHTGAEPRALAEHLHVERLRRILELRERAVVVAFENLVYTQSDLEPQRLYNDVIEQILQDTRRPVVRWPTHLDLILSPLSGFSEIVGAMIGAQVWEHLRTRFPQPWKREEVGGWIREYLFAPGASVPWEEKVEAATGKPVGIEPLARALDVSFEAPTLGETEEISDQAAAEYFEGIDLSDLE